MYLEIRLHVLSRNVDDSVTCWFRILQQYLGTLSFKMSINIGYPFS